MKRPIHGAWTLNVKITGNQAELTQDHGIGFLSGFFGAGVAIQGDALVDGSTLDATDGAAYIYRHNGTNWVQDTFILPRNTTGISDRAGEDVMLSSSQMLIMGA